jgi:hypothetical protein
VVDFRHEGKLLEASKIHHRDYNHVHLICGYLHVWQWRIKHKRWRWSGCKVREIPRLQKLDQK